MKIITVITLIIFQSVIATAQISNNGWKNLTPLVSTQADVERILGKPSNPKLNIYKSQETITWVVYADGSCGKHKKNPEGFSNDTLVEMKIALNSTFKLLSIFPDLSAFEKSKDPLKDNLFYYSNKDQSLSFQTRRNEDNLETIISISVGPSQKDKDQLCK